MPEPVLGLRPSLTEIIDYLRKSVDAAEICCLWHVPELLGVLQARVLIATSALRQIEARP